MPFEDEKPVILEILTNSGRGGDYDHVAAAIEKAGGYSAIVGNDALWASFGDLLDPMVSQRVVDIRNALRELGWDDDGSRPMHGGPLKFDPANPDSEYTLDYEVKSTKTNAIVCSYKVKGVTGFFMSDRWTRPAAEMAKLIHGAVLQHQQKHQHQHRVASAEKRFNTHVYAVVRVKVLGTNGNDPAKIADEIADAVSQDPDQWLEPRQGQVRTSDGSFYDIEQVEFADEVNWVLVDEKDGDDNVVKEHHFDHLIEPMENLSGSTTAKEAHLQQQVEAMRASLAAIGAAIENGGSEDIAGAWLSARSRFDITFDEAGPDCEDPTAPTPGVCP